MLTASGQCVARSKSVSTSESMCASSRPSLVTTMVNSTSPPVSGTEVGSGVFVKAISGSTSSIVTVALSEAVSSPASLKACASTTSVWVPGSPITIAVNKQL